MPLMSRREKIIDLFFKAKPETEFSCDQIVKQFIEDKEPTSSQHGYHYFSGSISSILNKLVKDNVLRYSNNKTKRGGHLYQLKIPKCQK
jgi:hypothetical protein